MATRKSYPKCPSCKKWTVGGANYCHHCGHYLKTNPGQFNSQAPIIPGPVTPREPGHASGSRATFTDAAVISLLAVGSVTALAGEYYTVAIGLVVPLAVYTVPKLSPVLADVKTIWSTPRPPVQERPASRPSVLQVEFVDEYGRPRILDGFPMEIDLEQLAHIAQRIEAGKPFSRRAMVRSGKLSQPQFEQVQAVMLQKEWAYKVKPDAKNSPVALKQKGRAILRAAKIDYDMVVVGGGWLAPSQNRPQIGATGAGQGQHSNQEL